MDISKAYDSASTTMLEKNRSRRSLVANLWRNFYDALLARLEEVKEEVSYEIKEERDLDFNEETKENLSISFNVTAFMDDRC
ncbi:unnamed protein product [Rhizophagus irregularis]|uniref:Uncharacterized protein n=1 Tax=Rhizophagus irregularis TaxID=588596 RepID=A0A2I1H521_9GLOM|nr:hypothetical protein RhiirA4_472466 [Rhizophagus irregularis]CAB4430807.1 unnamed protein product [Rhizophagus irregularis]